MQLEHPQVTIGFDSDAKTAAATRAKVFHAVAKEGALVGGAHLSFPGLGHLRVDGKGYDWLPVAYSQLR